MKMIVLIIVISIMIIVINAGTVITRIIITAITIVVI